MNITTVRLAVALTIGLIIGLERGWESRDSPAGLRAAGIRSFGLIGLLGGLAALLATQFGGSILVMAFAGLVLLVGLSYGITAPRTRDFGITTELALLITFLLGALTGKGMIAEAVAVAVVTTALLGFKQELHQSLRHLNRQELLATLQLLLIAAVVLPLLPDHNLGPWAALNPRAIGLLVLLIAGLSYMGYFAMRFLGSRVGLLATAALGALVSSTAVTVAFGRMARRGGNPALLGAGIALAAGTMALRILVEVSIVNPALLPSLVLPIAVLAVVPLLTAGVIATRTKAAASSAEVELKNPIELGAALGYGAVFALLFILIRAMETWFGNAGIYALAAVSGITDVDAVSLSLAQAAQGDLPLQVATTGILTAAMVNTAVKALLATAIGGWRLARWSASILLLTLGLSVIAAFSIHG